MSKGEDCIDPPESVTYLKAILLFAFSSEPKSGARKVDWLGQMSKLNEEDSERKIEKSISRVRDK